MAKMLQCLLLFLLPLWCVSCSGQMYASYDPVTGKKTELYVQGSLMEDSTSDAATFTGQKGVKVGRIVAGKNQEGVPKAGLTAWGAAKVSDNLYKTNNSNNATSSYGKQVDGTVASKPTITTNTGPPGGTQTTVTPAASIPAPPKF